MENTENKHFDSKQYLLNFVSNSAVYGLNIFIRIFLTPLIITNFSLAQFGLFSAVTDFTTGILSIVSCFILAANRYLTIAIREMKLEKASKILNTALSMTLKALAIGTPIMCIFLYVNNQSSQLPDNLRGEFQALVFLLSVQILFEILRIVLSSKLISENRLDLDNISIFTTRILYLGLFFLLLANQQESLFFIGLIIAFSSLIGLTIAYIFFRKIEPSIPLTLKSDKALNKEIFQVSTWLLLDSLGSFLFIRSGSIIAAYWLGPDMAGIYSAFFSIAYGLRVLSEVFSKISIPRLYKNYAENKKSALQHDLLKIIKFQGAVMGFIIGIFCGFSKPILHIWLGDTFSFYNSMLIVMIAHLVINLALSPLFNIQLIFNKMKYPSLVNLFTGLVSISSSILLITKFNLGIWGIIISEATTITLKNLLFSISFNSKITGLRIKDLMKNLIFGIAGFVIIFSTTYSLNSFLQIENIFIILFIAGLLGVIFFTVFFNYFFDNAFIRDIIDILKKPFRS